MITKPTRILVPTDFSETACHAMHYAGDLAARIGASLTVLYSDSFLPPLDYSATISGWDQTSFDELKWQAEEQLRREAKANIPPSVQYHAVVRVASAIEGIVTQAREDGTDLIVMGTHGRTGFRRLLLGSVTEAVMRRVEVPVIAVPPTGESRPAIRTVICPAVDTEPCIDALELAALIAPADAKFILIGGAPSSVSGETTDLTGLRDWVPAAIAGRCELKVFGSGEVTSQIEDYAGRVHADLILATESGNRSAGDLIYGTFAARIIQHSSCPVLTVNRPTARRFAERQQAQTAGAHR